MSRLLTSEEIEALLESGPIVHAPRECAQVVIEAGRAEATFSELSRLKPGSILALDMASPGRVLVVANGTPIAHGSLVTRGNRVAVQIESLVSPGGAGR